MLLLSVLFLLPVYSTNGKAQNFVGMKEPEIMQYMNRNLPEFVRQKDIVNDRFNYLRFETNDGMQTMLVFLNDKMICSEVRVNFDRALLGVKTRELNDKYSKSGENIWTEIRGRKHYSLSLKDDNWYYTLSIREKTK
jgi:hypothetical protein